MLSFHNNNYHYRITLLKTGHSYNVAERCDRIIITKIARCSGGCHGSWGYIIEVMRLKNA